MEHLQQLARYWRDAGTDDCARWICDSGLWCHYRLRSRRRERIDDERAGFGLSDCWRPVSLTRAFVAFADDVQVSLDINSLTSQTEQGPQLHLWYLQRVCLDRHHIRDDHHSAASPARSRDSVQSRL